MVLSMAKLGNLAPESKNNFAPSTIKTAEFEAKNRPKARKKKKRDI